jgi:uncharacterized repeat protein (TIGR03803 family)
VQGTDGSFYGTTCCKGTNGQGGTVFKITSAGKLTTLYNFCTQGGCADGDEPKDALVQATGGNFYGTTHAGGANGGGTVFKITPLRNLTILYSFSGADGSLPYAGLVQDTVGSFYGTTLSGGSDGLGTVFSLSTGLGPFVTFVSDSQRWEARLKSSGKASKAQPPFLSTELPRSSWSTQTRT